MSDKFKDDDLFGEEPENRRAGDEFLIVGIGASAGGITALKEFFSQVPADSGMAYVVILHLSPDHDSKLAEVLQSTTSVPVIQVKDNIRVQANHVYVISPNQSLAMSDGHLSLSEMTKIEERRAPVDIFFRTLAESHHSRAVCVILSGTGANGSMGIKRVKEYGGVCIAQEPNEAQYSDMPRNSIATGMVDYVLPVAEIPGRIIAYKEHLGTVTPVGEKKREESDDHALWDIFTQLRHRTGHDFSNYKRSTVLRRIERRISVHELPDLPAFANFLREKPEEARALLKDLLITVTNFFRDARPFEQLEQTVIPRLFEGKGPEDHVRVWVAGCATGEEAYSMAMLLLEFAGDSIDRPTIQVFATDIDEWAITKAREGYYTLNDAADVSPERLRRFFVKDREGYRVRREIREMVLFAQHNLIKDPPFSHLDLISCRNLLIYLNRSAQERTLEVLHFALNPEGYLFLGTSESVEGAKGLFIAVDKDNHIFRSRPVETRLTLPIPSLTLTSGMMKYRLDVRIQEPPVYERLSYLDLHQRLLEQYAPPSIVVNEEFDVVHVSAGAGRYMQIPVGEPSHNLLRLIRPELRLELRTALYQATQGSSNSEAPGLEVKVNDQTERINLKVRPVLRADDTTRGFILVIFEPEQDKEEPTQRKDPVVISGEPIARRLEEELMRVREQLRATSEQHELQQEELKSSNEELQAMNEELRSAAEELETSKEELQSVNEELITVNQELKIKIEEISQTSNDFQNLIHSTDIATIFLDRALRVKLFTPRARDIFNLIASDVGRPLSDITSQLKDSRLMSSVDQVLDKLQTIEREVTTTDDRWFLMRILPYRTSDDRINGVVLRFTDVSERRQAFEAVHAAELKLRLANDNALKEARAGRDDAVDRLVLAQETERRKIARDLHDQLGQQLTALRLQLEILKGRVVEDAKAFDQIEEIQTITRRIESEIDFLSWELRPLALDDLGLQAALNNFVESWSDHAQIAAHFHSRGLDSIRLTPDAETQLYRIAQEALNNVRKHAGATRVDVLLESRDHHVVLIIEDNGSGFDTVAKLNRKHGLGLLGMRERAMLIGGTLEIEAGPEKGTTVFVRLPPQSKALLRSNEHAENPDR
jgi:two-component system, chemotaxis family, CheB/CheR fusion protein